MSNKKLSKPLFSATKVFFDYLYVSVYQPDMDKLNGEDSKGMSNIEIALKNPSTLDIP
ncbi:MAG: hypothetical protein AB8G77_25625 [Rhodothermales bacterium]